MRRLLIRLARFVRTVTPIVIAALTTAGAIVDRLPAPFAPPTIAMRAPCICGPSSVCAIANVSTDVTWESASESLGVARCGAPTPPQP